MDRLSRVEFRQAMKLILPFDKQEDDYVSMMESIYKGDENYSIWVEKCMKRLISDEWKNIKKVDGMVLLPTIYDFNGDVFVFDKIDYCRIKFNSANILIISSASEEQQYKFNLENELDRRIHISMISPPITEYILSLSDNYLTVESNI